MTEADEKRLAEIRERVDLCFRLAKSASAVTKEDRRQARLACERDAVLDQSFLLWIIADLKQENERLRAAITRNAEHMRDRPVFVKLGVDPDD